MALKTTEVEAKGGRSRHRSLGLSDEQALRIYEVMRLARAVDERMWLINRQGRAPFVISCQGQEGAQVGIAAALRPGSDWVAPSYRDAGVVLWFGMTARDQMLSFFARREDPNSGGRQMPGHFGSRRLHIVTGGSPVATQLLHAARRGEGPSLIEVKTYRFTAHSSDDDDKRYREAEEVAIWRQKDPIQKYAAYLRDAGTLTDPVEAEITERITQQVDEATEYAEQAPDPTPDDRPPFVYK